MSVDPDDFHMHFSMSRGEHARIVPVPFGGPSGATNGGADAVTRSQRFLWVFIGMSVARHKKKRGSQAIGN